MTGADPRAAERRARVLLARVGEPGDLALGGLVAEHGAVAVADALRPGGSLLPARHRDALRTRLMAADPEADLARATELGGRVLIPGDLEWPSQLDDLGAAAPLALWVVGAANLRLVVLRSVAVVGARAATSYGQGVARELAAALASRGWTVVSGGAFGIDAAAHRGALAAGGVTACVLASGVDVPYPRAHDALIARIADDGLVVSESPPGESALRRRFLTRNRLIAAITQGTVVVEAALRSGSLNTAAHAERLNRPVLGVPGPVTSAMSAGVHDLLRLGGAGLVCSADDVIDRLGALGGDAAPQARGPWRPRDALAPREARVLEAIGPRRPASLDGIVRDCGLPAAEVVPALGRLQAAGFLRREADGWVLAPLARQADGALGVGPGPRGLPG